jgi:heptosyltransferase-3
MKPLSILVVVVSRFGDTLIATPVMRSLHDNFPNAKITVAAHPKRKIILLHLPYIHKLIGLSKTYAKIRTIFACRKKFDLALSIEPDPVFTKYVIANSKKTISFKHKDAEINNRLDIVVEEPVERIHAVKHKTLLLEALNLKANSYRLDYVVSIDEKKRASSILQKEFKEMPSHDLLIGIQTSSFHTKSFRDWPKHHFVTLCNQLHTTNPKALFIFFGGPDDNDKNQEICDEMTPASLNLSGLDLRTTGAVMSMCSLLIGVDTGPTHIMGTQNIPLVGIYHCLLTSDYIGPIGHPSFKGVNLSSNGKCTKEETLSKIQPEQVAKECNNLLENKKK